MVAVIGLSYLLWPPALGILQAGGPVGQESTDSSRRDTVRYAFLQRFTA